MLLVMRKGILCTMAHITSVSLCLLFVFTASTYAAKCERLHRHICSDLGYNTTKLPNTIGHQTEGQAWAHFHMFNPLIRMGCSLQLLPFLCGLHFPPCHEAGFIIPPCRSLCQDAKTGCEPVLLKFGVPWPEYASCELFPEGGVCFEPGKKLEEKQTENKESSLKDETGSGESAKEETGEVDLPSETKESLKVKKQENTKLEKSKDEDASKESACQQVPSPMCSKLGFNMTRFPNMLGYNNPRDAAMVAQQFYPLVQVGCSPQLGPFVCSLFFPQCHKPEVVVPPCRSLCLEAKKGCEPLLVKMGTEWPEELRCDKFLVSGRCFAPGTTEQKQIENEESTGEDESGSGELAIEEDESGSGELTNEKTGKVELPTETKESLKDKLSEQKQTDQEELTEDESGSGELAIEEVGKVELPTKTKESTKEEKQDDTKPENSSDKPSEQKQTDQEEWTEDESGSGELAKEEVGKVEQPTKTKDSTKEEKRDDTKPEKSSNKPSEQNQTDQEEWTEDESGSGELAKEEGGKVEQPTETKESMKEEKQEDTKPEKSSDKPSEQKQTDQEELTEDESGSGELAKEEVGKVEQPTETKESTKEEKQEDTKPDKSSRNDLIGTTCHSIPSSMCSNLGYDRARFPNMLGHVNPSNASLEAQRFAALIKTGCSPLLGPLVCSLFFPQCHKTEVVSPCRSLCLEARSGCEPLLVLYGFEWPEPLRCDNLPESGHCFTPVLTNTSAMKPKPERKQAENEKSTKEITEALKVEKQGNATSQNSSGRQCQRVPSPMCSNMGYKLARFPNILGHVNRREAAIEVQQFLPLVKVGCSPQLVPFLCSLYFPQCRYREVVYPCRSLCLEARSGCEPLMLRHGFEWPETMRCDQFPVSGRCFAPVLTNASAMRPEPERKQAENEKSTKEITEAVKVEKQGNAKLQNSSGGQCHRIPSPMCSNIGYNMARFPNMLGHVNPHEAAKEVQRFYPMVKTGWSPQLAPFLCSLYFPQCRGTEVVYPCRSLCLEARSGCEPFMRIVGMEWPETMRCDQFPVSGRCFAPGRELVSTVLKKKKSKKPRSKRPKIGQNKGKSSSKKSMQNRTRRMMSDDPSILETPQSRPRHRNRRGPRVRACLHFESDLCPKIPYTMAGFPNLLGHRNPRQAESQLRVLLPLIKTGCSNRLMDFLCGVHFPECIDRKVVAPCKHVCDEAHSSCLTSLAKTGFGWPSRLACRNFPRGGDCFGKGDDPIIVLPASIVNASATRPSTDGQKVRVDDQPISTDISPLIADLLNRAFMNPFMEWIKSSTILNNDQAQLAVEQTKVAKLKEEKLGLEIDDLKTEIGNLTASNVPK